MPRQAGGVSAREDSARHDRETTNAINAAIADTDAEILSYAFGDEQADADADDSLEQMGEGLEGDHLDDEGDQGDEIDDDQVEAREDDDDDHGEEPDDRRRDDRERDERQPQQRRDERRESERRFDRRREDERDDRRDDRYDDRRGDERGVPPRVHAEMRREWRGAERRADTLSTENAQLRDELRRMNERLDMLARPAAPPPRQQQQQREELDSRPPPDVFQDPASYTNWIQDTIRREVGNGVRAFQAHQQQTVERRMNESFEHAARGIRSYEFGVAYNDLRDEIGRLGNGPDGRALLDQISHSANPAAAVMDWWERTSDPEYIEYHRDQLREFYAGRQRSRGRGREEFDRRAGYDDSRDDRRFDDRGRYDDRGYERRDERRYGERRGRERGGYDRGEPREEYRLPSLNSAVGGARQHSAEMQEMPGSDLDIMAAAFQR